MLIFLRRIKLILLDLFFLSFLINETIFFTSLILKYFESLNIEDKSFLHKNHKGNQEGKYHLKLIIVSQELKKMNKIESNKKIYKILNQELKEFIHSIQILIS